MEKVMIVDRMRWRTCIACDVQFSQRRLR